MCSTVPGLGGPLHAIHRNLRATNVTAGVSGRDILSSVDSLACYTELKAAGHGGAKPCPFANSSFLIP